MKARLITIDGPAGSGKTTVARLLSKRLNMRCLNTGLMYRAFAWWAVEKGLVPWNPKAEEGLEEFLVEFGEEGESQKVFVSGRDISSNLCDPKVEMLSSELSKIEAVRSRMLVLQRLEGEKGPLVAEGRDMGTVVFPNADIKFFLTAKEGTRAYRRWKERRDKGELVEYHQVLEELKKRDMQDSTREIAPLVVPEGAIVVDTTDRGIEEVLEILLGHVSAYEG